MASSNDRCVSKLFKHLRANEGSISMDTIKCFLDAVRELRTDVLNQNNFRMKVKHAVDSSFPKDFCILIDILFGSVPNSIVLLDLLSNKVDILTKKKMDEFKELRKIELDVKEMKRERSILSYGRSSSDSTDISALNSIFLDICANKNIHPDMKKYIEDFLEPNGLLNDIDKFSDFSSTDITSKKSQNQPDLQGKFTEIKGKMSAYERESSHAIKQKYAADISDLFDLCWGNFETFNTLTHAMLPAKASLSAPGNERDYTLVQSKAQQAVVKKMVFNNGKDSQVTYTLFSYFLINLLKFPYLMFSEDRPMPFSHSFTRDGNLEPSLLYSENLYFKILGTYFDYFIPPSDLNRGNSSSSSSSSFSNSNNSNSRPRDSPAYKNQQDLFISLLIGYWIDTSCVQRYAFQSTFISPQFAHKAVMYLGRFLKVEKSSNMENSISAKKPMTLIVNFCRKSHGSFTYNINAMLCTFLVLHHVMSKVTVKEWKTHSDGISSYITSNLRNFRIKKAISELQELKEKKIGQYGVPSPEPSEITQLEYLSDSIKRFQQPLYDKLRATFDTCPDINSREGFDMFRISVEVWLLYIQPWTLDSGKFSDDWRPYVAANYHFYTALLVLFCKAISTLSRDNLDDIEKLNLILKVFGVFNNELRDAIYSIYAACKNVITNNHKKGRNENDDKVELQLCTLVIAQHIHLYPDCHPSKRGLQLVDIINLDVSSSLDPFIGENDISTNILYLKRRIILLQADRKIPNPSSNDEDSSDGGIIVRQIYRIWIWFFGSKKVSTMMEPRFSIGNSSIDKSHPLSQCVIEINRIFKATREVTNEKGNYTDKSMKSTRNFLRDIPHPDELLEPIKCYELGILTSFLIFISIAGNKYFALPRHSNDSLIMLKWDQYFEYIIFKKPSMFFGTFRFNLRFLGSYYTHSFLVSYFMLNCFSFKGGMVRFICYYFLMELLLYFIIGCSLLAYK